MRAAHAHGTLVSYDLNYRPSLWKEAGGLAAARELNRRLAPLVDIMLGNEEDFTACLGFDVADTGPNLDALDPESFRVMISEVAATHDTIAAVATTLRTVHSASINDWGAVAWSAEDGFVEANPRRALEIFDRVGGGDSFASGLLYGLLELEDLHAAVEHGAAHSALAMTTPGDTSTARLDDVRRLIERPSARVQR
jgi:2-dehydro-3-deoxygluconokinase